MLGAGAQYRRVQVPMEMAEGQSPWSWCYRWLWAPWYEAGSHHLDPVQVQYELLSTELSLHPGALIIYVCVPAYVCMSL